MLSLLQRSARVLVNATFPLETRASEVRCVSRYPSTRNVKDSKERTRFVNACKGGRREVGGGGRGLHSRMPSASKLDWNLQPKLGCVAIRFVPSAVHGPEAVQVVFTIDACKPSCILASMNIRNLTSNMNVDIHTDLLSHCGCCLASQTCERELIDVLTDCTTDIHLPESLAFTDLCTYIMRVQDIQIPNTPEYQRPKASKTPSICFGSIIPPASNMNVSSG